jgi:hypothetical protein
MGRLSILVTFVRQTCAREKHPVSLAEVCKFMNRDPRTIKGYGETINKLHEVGDYEDVIFDGDSFDIKLEIPRKFDLKQKELSDFV